MTRMAKLPGSVRYCQVIVGKTSLYRLTYRTNPTGPAFFRGPLPLSTRDQRYYCSRGVCRESQSTGARDDPFRKLFRSGSVLITRHRLPFPPVSADCCFQYWKMPLYRVLVPLSNLHYALRCRQHFCFDLLDRLFFKHRQSQPLCYLV